MILCLDLDEKVIVHLFGTHFHRFHRDELLIHVLHKLAFGIPHSYLKDPVLGGDDSRWEAGFNFMLRHLEERFGDLVSINSLSIWVTMFPMFTEVARSKHSASWDKNEDFPGEIVYGNPESFNVCGIMDICDHEMCRLGSVPVAEGEDQPRSPDVCAKQRSARDGHHKFHGVSCASISYPNGISTVVGLHSARNHDSTILT